MYFFFGEWIEHRHWWIIIILSNFKLYRQNYKIQTIPISGIKFHYKWDQFVVEPFSISYMVGITKKKIGIFFFPFEL